ncbi:hypothetical protein COCON_G00041070 [Conger conger]|uniref:Uncharacterized protein n=1 Tax=Conger conger TaxID=82655 RepID=A0A9Q1DTK6_CONCO|nr:hypothetical protein COCON_G00041070 [Conger conger]
MAALVNLWSMRKQHFGRAAGRRSAGSGRRNVPGMISRENARTAIPLRRLRDPPGPTPNPRRPPVPAALRPCPRT